MYIAITSNENAIMIQNLRDQLLAWGGMDPLSLFLMGSAGARKATGINAAKKFCFEFCSSCVIIWSDTSFLYSIHGFSSICLRKMHHRKSFRFAYYHSNCSLRAQWEHYNLFPGSFWTLLLFYRLFSCFE